MVDILPRRKPVPIPRITAVPEHLAEGALNEVYKETKMALGVPWMGVVTMAFAHYATFYRALWNGMAPVVTTSEFAAACAMLRQTAEEAAASLAPPGIMDRLASRGYSVHEINEIKACNEVFSAGNMPYLLIATRARLLLEGYDWPRKTGTPSPRRSPAHPRPLLIEEHHTGADLKAIYADIRQTLGLPFVNTDYRAFARWPSYLEAAWSDLRPEINKPEYEAQVTRIHDTAVNLALNLPNPTGLSPSSLKEAARAEKGDVNETVCLFQWLLPALAMNVAFFRIQLGIQCLQTAD